HRRAAVCRTRIPELPTVVPAPALNHGASWRRARHVAGTRVLAQRTRVVSARADLLVDTVADDANWKVHRRGSGRIAELAVGVVAPAPGVAVTVVEKLERARV